MLTRVAFAAAACHPRRGLKLDVADEETDNKFREPFFNFYDDRLMGLEWSKQPNTELTCQFFRLLALCHTVIPEGACTATERPPAGVLRVQQLLVGLETSTK